MEHTINGAVQNPSISRVVPSQSSRLCLQPQEWYREQKKKFLAVDEDELARRLAASQVTTTPGAGAESNK